MNPEKHFLEKMLTRTENSFRFAVVGPCRIGKSSFIKVFVENVIIPNLVSPDMKEEVLEQIPKITTGRDVSTREPLYVTREDVEIQLVEERIIRPQIIECVGYRTHGTRGYIADTPLNRQKANETNEILLFEETTEFLTKDIVQNHTDFVIIVTSDGTIENIPRYACVDSEKRAVSHIGNIKPTVIILNSSCPDEEKTQLLASELNSLYNIPVIPMSVLHMTEDTIYSVLKTVFYQFPYEEINFELPSWVMELKENHPARETIKTAILEVMKGVQSYSDLENMIQDFNSNYSFVEEVKIIKNDLGKGTIDVELLLSNEFREKHKKVKSN